MSILSNLTEKYASSLDGLDIIKLFKWVEKETSRAEAARICGLERKTVYGWVEGKDVRLNTKIKVLTALLEWNYEKTLEYLMDKYSKSSLNIMDSLLDHIYISINAVTSDTDLLNKYNSYINILTKFAINNNLNNTAKFEMLEKIRYDLKNRNIPIENIPLQILDSKHIVELIPFVNTLYENNPNLNSEQLKNIYDIPIELSNNIINIRTRVFSSIKILDTSKIYGVENVTGAPYNLELVVNTVSPSLKFENEKWLA